MIGTYTLATSCALDQDHVSELWKLRLFSLRLPEASTAGTEVLRAGDWAPLTSGRYS